jgi:CYTH domain-containing protein
MAKEIERRFLVCNNQWQVLVQRCEPLAQGYLCMGQKGFTVRVRLGVEFGLLTLKAPTADARVRHEFEYPLPRGDATELLALCQWRLQKTRHQLQLEGGRWVVDVFEGDNAPLVIAEVELSAANAGLEIPRWCGEEITARGELSNAALAAHPWAKRQLPQIRRMS